MVKPVSRFPFSRLTPLQLPALGEGRRVGELGLGPAQHSTCYPSKGLARLLRLPFRPGLPRLGEGVGMRGVGHGLSGAGCAESCLSLPGSGPALGALFPLALPWPLRPTGPPCSLQLQGGTPQRKKHMHMHTHTHMYMRIHIYVHTRMHIVVVVVAVVLIVVVVLVLVLVLVLAIVLLVVILLLLLLLLLLLVVVLLLLLLATTSGTTGY